MPSKLFGNKAAIHPHLAQGTHGWTGEIADLRADVEGAFTALDLIIPTTNYLSQATWFVNPATGSDAVATTGLTSGTALKTKKELMRRIGAQNGPILVDMHVTFLVDEPNNNDRTPIDVDCSRFSLFLHGTMVQLDAGGAATATTNITRGAVEAGLQTLTFGTAASATYWTDIGAVGHWVRDTTQNAGGGGGCRALVYKDGGAKKAVLSRLSDIQVLATFNVPTPSRDPSGQTDAFVVERGCKIMITSLNSRGGNIAMENLWLQGTAGFTIPCARGTIIQANHCRFDSGPLLEGGGRFNNCYFAGGIFNLYLTVASINAGQVDSIYNGMFALDGDCIENANPNLCSGGPVIYGRVYFVRDRKFGQSSAAAGLMRSPLIKQIAVTNNGYGLPFIWGPGILDVSGGAQLSHVSSQTFVTTFVGGGLKLDGGTTALAMDVTANPPAWVQARNLTPALLDATFAGGGFAGFATGLKGSRIVASE